MVVSAPSQQPSGYHGGGFNPKDEQRIIRASALDEGSLSFLDGGSFDGIDSVEEGGDHSAVRMAYDTYFGSDSQSGVRMGEEKMARSSVEDDQLDQRKFLKESRTLMVGGLSVEKSLLNSFGVKTSTESREDDTSASQDLAKMSGSGFFRQSNFNKVSEEEILRMNAWASFKKYSIGQGDLKMDGGSRGVPVQQLSEALSRVAQSIPMLELSMIVARQQYPSKAVLKWQEFNALVHEIFHLNRNTTKQGTFGSVKTPLQSMRMTPSQHRLEVQRPSRMSLSSPKQRHQPQSRHHPDDGERLMMSQMHHHSLMSQLSDADIEAGGVGSISKVPQMKMNPFDRLLQKQRGASSIVMSQLPTGASNDIGTSESFVDIAGQKVSTKKLNDLMCKKFKTESSLQRKQRLEMQQLYPLKDQTMNKAEALQRLTKPLTKQKVFAMTHQEETYAGKWKRMREKREARYHREGKKSHRQAVLNTVTRLVADGEKGAMYKYLQERNAVEAVLAERHVEHRRDVERETQKNIVLRREDQRLERSQSAASMKAAIVQSVEATRAALRNEYRERKVLADESKFHLDDDSSALLVVPEEITRGINRARTLERWTEAKAREKKYLEDTMDARIRDYARKKAQKLNQAAENVTQFTHNPLDRQATTPYDLSIGHTHTPLSPPSRQPSSPSRGGGGNRVGTGAAGAGGAFGPMAGLNEGSTMSSVTNPIGVGAPGAGVEASYGYGHNQSAGKPRSPPSRGVHNSGAELAQALTGVVGTPQQYVYAPEPGATAAGSGPMQVQIDLAGALKHSNMRLVRRTNAANEKLKYASTGSAREGESGESQPDASIPADLAEGPYGASDDASFKSLATRESDGDDELNVMAIREYISTRSRIEGEDNDNIGKIIKSGMPESPVPFSDSPEPKEAGVGVVGDFTEPISGETSINVSNSSSLHGDATGTGANTEAMVAQRNTKRLPKLRTPGHGDFSASLGDLSSLQKEPSVGEEREGLGLGGDVRVKPSFHDSSSSSSSSEFDS